MILQRLKAGAHNNLLGALCDSAAQVFWTTVEEKGKEIPEGDYTVRRTTKPIHGICFEVMNVPDREGILFHKGNTAADVDGCIGVGLGFTEFTNGPGIAQSAMGYSRFLRFLNGVQEFHLKIINAR